MYAAPSIQGLLSRLEQDRRLLASLCRTLDTSLGESWETPRGHMSLRELVITVAIIDAARCALALETTVSLPPRT
jgi:hypothetical protein